MRANPKIPQQLVWLHRWRHASHIRLRQASGIARRRHAAAWLESRLQSLVEGSMMRLFGARKNQEADLGALLVAALKDGCKILEGGRVVAPNLFILVTHNSHLSQLEPDTEILQNLAVEVHKAGLAAGFEFLEPVTIRVVEDPTLPVAQVEVQAQITLENLAATTDIESEMQPTGAEMPAKAFLIIDGVRIYPLDRAVVNIGRRPDNHLVIDDPRVSRAHAQLRAIKGRYVIFDLESTGGTQVNGQPVHQAVLFPGDMISLAGIPMVYGQEENHLGETQKYGYSEAQSEPGEASE